MLDVLLIAPTGLDSMRAAAGDGGGLRQAAVSGAFTLLIAAMGVLLAVLVRQGRAWARLLLAAVGALLTLLGLATVNMDGAAWTTPEGALSVHGLLADAVPALAGAASPVLLFLPASNAYFSRRA
ncbi:MULTISPECIES: hypothetical protein [unclassified Nocardiopsis]|uniref:hypothetical protein n=1 Tax=unclassified Nocardiopsis TaxID=2649073 RepID=UPI000AA4CFE1|nr:hypothetical protein [Nocardiopsis sp. TSRI0078]